LIAVFSFVEICIVQDHAGHKFEFVKKSAPKYKKTLKESLTPLAQIQIDLEASGMIIMH